jgi:riboflavin synthase
MFTGIIEEVGAVRGIDLTEDGGTLRIAGPLVAEDTHLGASIAVNGVCLTVTSIEDGGFSADVMPETLKVTTLEDLKPGARVNLERALRASGRLDGHIVQGHVDGVAEVQSRAKAERWEDFTFDLPPELARYVARKGSIAINGVSLTVTRATDREFGVSLIPTTLQETTLGDLIPGQRVNIEVDVIAKYVERLIK